MNKFLKNKVFSLLIVLTYIVTSVCITSARPNVPYSETCKASYYFSTNKMANGQYMKSGQFTAAHRFAPFGTVYRVTNKSNGKQVVVTITDRGPFIPSRCIDLSRSAFAHISNPSIGVINVKITKIK